MITPQKQLLYFLLCVCIGFGNGLIYELFLFIRQIFRCNKRKRRWLGITIDVLFCLSFSSVCQIFSVWFHLPDLRVYMLCGYVVGFIIYSKSLRRIVAFLKKVCYNTCVGLWKSLKARKNSLKRLDKYD